LDSKETREQGVIQPRGFVAVNRYLSALTAADVSNQKEDEQKLRNLF
jgi:hypothetical protein